MDALNAENLNDYCIAMTKRIAGGKWTIYIIGTLIEHGGTLRFGEICRLIPNVTQSTLAKQMDILEEASCVTRVEYPQIPPKVEYSLTPLGWKMASVLKALREFTAEYKRYLLSGQVPPHSV